MKQIILQNQEEAEKHIETLRHTAHEAQQRVQAISTSSSSLGFLEQLKFKKVGCDPLDGSRALNIIEQINQTFTYLASFRAAKLLFQWHESVGPLTLNLGTAKGSDIETTENDDIAAEIFAATSPGSNLKLKKDIAKVHATDAKYKYVFFICPNIEAGRYETPGSDEVIVWSLGV